MSCFPLLTSKFLRWNAKNAADMILHCYDAQDLTSEDDSDDESRGRQIPSTADRQVDECSDEEVSMTQLLVDKQRVVCFMTQPDRMASVSVVMPFWCRSSAGPGQ